MEQDSYKLISRLWRNGKYAYLWYGEMKETVWFKNEEDWVVLSQSPSEQKPNLVGKELIEERKLYEHEPKILNEFFGIHPCLYLPSKDNLRQIRPSSKNREIHLINGLFLDMDLKNFGGDKNVLKQYIDSLLPPSAVVDSGHGYHLYYFLKETFYLFGEENWNRASRLQKALAEKTNADKAATDLSRMARVVGTFNSKHEDENLLVLLEEWNPEIEYSLEDLEKYAGVSRSSGIPIIKEPRIIPDNSTVADAKNYLDNLSSSRADDYQQWLEIGMSLTELGDDGLRLWDEWSRQSEKYDPDVLEDKWQTFETAYKGESEKLTLRSLRFWAEEDSAEVSASYHLTDLGNAERLVSKCGEDLRYLHSESCWLVWNGKQWVKDDQELVKQKAKEVVMSIYAEASKALDSSERKAIGNWAKSSESDYRIKGMLSLAQPDLAIRSEELDKDPYLLNVANGTINLKTGKLQPHKKENYLTKIVDINYNPDAECPFWKQHLETITAHDTELQTYLQKSFGYALTGNTDEQCAFFLVGSGANGKSTTLKVLTLITGDYSRQSDSDALLMWSRNKNPEAAKPALYRLRGARAVITSEVGEGSKLNEKQVKEITGQNTISIRNVYSTPIEFDPEFKIFVDSNYRPTITGDDLGIWRRIRIIPFSVTIPKEKRIPLSDMMNQFESEASGILRWAVEGCLLWQSKGLNMPNRVEDATNDYKTSQDVFQQFLDECVTFHPQAVEEKDKIFKAWQKWVKDNNEYTRIKRKRDVTTRLMKRGCSHAGNWAKSTHLQGCRLNTTVKSMPYQKMGD